MTWVTWEESDPEDNWALLAEAFRFLLSPIMLPYTIATGVYDYMEGTSHLDHEETLRNTLLWGGIAGASWGYHLLMFPGQYSWLSPGGAFKTAAYLGGVPLAAVVVATASAAGYVATSDVHGGAIPGVTSFGGVGPGYYQDSSDPMDEFEEGVAGFWALLGF